MAGFKINGRVIEVIDDQVATIMRAKTPAEKMAIASQMHRAALEMIEANMRKDFPGIDQNELREKVNQRIFGV